MATQYCRNSIEKLKVSFSRLLKGILEFRHKHIRTQKRVQNVHPRDQKKLEVTVNANYQTLSFVSANIEISR
jgi:hypothetical protein